MKSNIANNVKFIKIEHEDILWLKVKKEKIDLENGIYFGAIYIAPPNSSSTQTKYKIDTYMILRIEISLFNSLGGDILLGGDFNSRMGNKYKDFIISDSDDLLPLDSHMIQTDTHTFRSSQDKKFYTNGRHLADLCKVNNLKY